MFIINKVLMSKNIVSFPRKNRVWFMVLVPGGLSEISVDSQSRSPILRSVELVSCPGWSSSASYSLPPFPAEMFGGEVAWVGGEEVMVCGGANWTSTHQQCYTWSTSAREELISDNKIGTFSTSSHLIFKPFLQSSNYPGMQRKI